jgi:hypothetical protein
MKKITILLFLIVSTALFSQENRHIWKTELGDFNVKYFGRGSWYDAEKFSNSGWKIPTGDEFSKILKKTSLWFEGWNDLTSDGWDANEVDGLYFWTSLDEGSTWSCDKKCAMVVMWGWDKYNPEYTTRDKDFGSLGIVLVKKVVKKASIKKVSKKHK